MNDRIASRRAAAAMMLLVLFTAGAGWGAEEMAGLKRQAQPGFGLRGDAEGLLVEFVEAGSAAAIAGLNAGDRLLRIDGIEFTDPDQSEAQLQRWRAGDTARLTVSRGGQRQEIEFTAASRPLEAIPGVESHYGAVTTPDGARLRTIIALPSGGDSPRHPLLFTQWVSCGSVEYRQGSNARELLARLARESGLALVRVERSSDGDSVGPACHELDYDTEVSHYIHAFGALLKNPLLDSSRVFVYGSSLGSTTAPLVARALQDGGADIAGIVVQGGGAVTYYERMLNFDRNYLERRPDAVSPAQIHAQMLARAKFHYEYLVGKRHPDEVAGDSAEMAAIRADVLGMGSSDHYGRPFAWHQQAASHNFLAAWAALEAPVLVIFNQFDQFEGRHGHRLIVDTVNRLRPGSAQYVERPRIGHSDNEYPTVEAAYSREGGKPAWDGAAEIILSWLRGLE